MKILKRTVQGFLFLAIFLGFIVLTGVIKVDNIYYGQFFFDAIIFLAMAVALFEMISATKTKGYSPQVIPLVIILIISYPTIKLFHHFMGSGYHGLLVFLAFSFSLLFLFYIFDQKCSFNDFLISLFLVFYPIVPMLIAVQVINMYGMLPLLLAIGAAMMADVFAFYFGSLIKGPKIFPKISPKKTYSGFIMGMIGGAIGAILVYALFELTPIPLNRIVIFGEKYNPWLFYSLIGVVIGVIGEIGDLAASRVKRSLEIKDFGKILGSHGGIIDRLDSMFFAVLFVAIFMSFTCFV